jgi:hypothetical protein
MKLLSYFAIPFILFGQSTLGPVTGHLSINRNKIRAGESIEVRFEAVNRGREAIQVTTGAPESVMCGHFRVKISSDHVALEVPPLPQGNIVGSCLSGAQDIAPGHKYAESFWIGRDGEFSRPGKYPIDVTYYFAYDKRGVFAHEGSPGARFHSQFTVTVEKPAK